MFVGYGVYLRQTYLRQVLPHPLSWFLFLTLTLVAFCVLVSNKDALGFLAVAIAFVAYGLYLRDTYLGKVSPHPLTWFLFGSTTYVTFFVQVEKGADAGSWVMGLSALMCFVVSGYSRYKGGKWAYARSDWAYFWGALGLLVFYYVVTVYFSEMDPTFSAVLATLADLVAYGPTIDKGWRKPYDDSVTSFILNCWKFVPALFALGSYSLATALLPGALVIANAGVAFMLLSRRSEMTITQ